MRRFKKVFLSLGLAAGLILTGILSAAAQTPITQKQKAPAKVAKGEFKQKAAQLRATIREDRAKLKADRKLTGKGSAEVKADRKQFRKDARALQRFRKSLAKIRRDAIKRKK